MKRYVLLQITFFLLISANAQKRKPITRAVLTATNRMLVIPQETGLNRYERKSDGFLLNGDYTIRETLEDYRTDIVNSYYPTGIKYLGSFSKGYKNGFWKTTFNNKLVKTENWSKGLMIGLYRVYDKDGQIRYKTTFGPKGNGLYRDFYYETGMLKEEGYYKNGKKEGEWCTYDEKGEQTSDLHYSKGLPKEEE